MAINRREFLKLAGFASSGLYLSTDPLWALPQNAPQRQGSAKRVVVLGAGLAGLVAGWELERSGHDVTILEAQLHPGGRVHTIREGFSDDLYAEAGAARIPVSHTITREWIKHFGLELEQFLPTELSEVALMKGKRVKMPRDKALDMSEVPLNLTPEERRVGLDGLDEHYYGELLKKIGEASSEDWPPEIMRLADISMGDFLRQRGASEDAIHYMMLGFEQAAALYMIRENSFILSGSKAKIKGGNDLLPRAFAAELSDVIRYGCAVEHIERAESRVRVAYRRAGLLDNVEAEAVVCTIPYGVLRHIAVTPEWTPAKRKVIDNLYYGPVVRTTFQVRRRYWEDEGLNGFGTSDKNFEVWHPTHSKAGRRGLLQSYVFEDYAHRLSELNESDRMERMIGDLEEVHRGLRKHLETVVTKCWLNDPWQRGAYTVYQPGQQEWYPEICRREGRVWFAGEHASPFPAWMQGALVSGIKAAREIDAEPKPTT